MKNDFLCDTCNRGVWHKSLICVTVGNGTIIELTSVCILKCPKCGREYMLDKASPAHAFPLKSPEAGKLLEQAVKEEWFDKIEESVNALKLRRLSAAKSGCADGTGSYAGLASREWSPPASMEDKPYPGFAAPSPEPAGNK